MLPVEASSYGLWVRWSLGLARPASNIDHKPGFCSQAWNLLLCSMGRGFPSFHVHNMRVLDWVTTFINSN